MPLDLSHISSLQDAVVTVMGLGRYKQGSGIGAAKWLMRHGAQIVITDLKTQEELRESVEEITTWYGRYREQYPERTIYSPLFVLGEHREEDFTDADLVVQNPGVPRESAFVRLAKERGVSVESDVSLFFRHCPFPIYVVTGTRGKSTTTALIGDILRTVHPNAVVAGNMAVSPLEYLDELLTAPAPVPVVLELSSWLIDSLEIVDRGPDIGVLTNVYEDHLNRYGSYTDYQHAKESLFQHQTPEQLAVLNFDHPLVREIGSRVRSRVRWFSTRPLVDRDGCCVNTAGMMVSVESGREVPILPVSEIRLAGEHNLQNALAAALVGHLVGVPADRIAEVLRSFEGLPGRQELVRETNGVFYVNDTTATSPDGTIAALTRFASQGKPHIVLLAGGSSKNVSFEALGESVRKHCKFVVLFEGSATDALCSAIGDMVPNVRVSSMSDAVAAAARVAERDDVVLLSPGTASFGMFQNEFDRGGQFVDIVKGL
ncbi:UDP-N-acetylmuramoyl-L-alanine--D-glutamate ligase [Candidatus Uhrbacteria bacterium]|nr:UDP-N-acetylmuramoyl-L-alanine--D-glutamate ligase [Candidatus Uhrbacteria bacterium]